MSCRFLLLVSLGFACSEGSGNEGLGPGTPDAADAADASDPGAPDAADAGPLDFRIPMPDAGPPGAAGAWAPMAPAPESFGRLGATALWTGSEVMIWGGLDEDTDPEPKGAVYDPALDTWRAVAPDPGVGIRAACVEWTGDAVFVSGNVDASTRTAGLYDPSTDTWRSVSQDGAPTARATPACVWIGDELIVWGGSDGTGAAYDPVTDTWRPLPEVPGIQALEPNGVWTGVDAFFIWSSGPLIAYRPSEDAWLLPSSVDAPVVGAKRLAWTGSEVIAWGPIGGPIPLMDGARYDPSMDRWTPMDGRHRLVPRAGFVSAWTGSDLIIWGGDELGGFARQFRDGALYNPVRDAWTDIQTDGAPIVRSQAVGVWTGRELIYWSGTTDGGDLYREDGGRLDPYAE